MNVNELYAMSQLLDYECSRKENNPNAENKLRARGAKKFKAKNIKRKMAKKTKKRNR